MKYKDSIKVSITAVHDFNDGSLKSNNPIIMAVANPIPPFMYK